MRLSRFPARPLLAALIVGAATALTFWGLVQAQEKPASSANGEDHPKAAPENFQSVMLRMKAAKDEINKKHADLLAERYDLKDNPAKDVAMSRGKPVQVGPRAKLPKGMTWEKLAALAPEEMRARDLFPQGFRPLSHPNHDEGGMVFPKFHIKEILKQEQRDLTRFDLDFDLPDHFLPEFPPPIFLTTRTDLGDIAKGEVVNPALYYMRATPYFETASEKYNFLNLMAAVAYGHRLATGPVYSVFEIL